MSSTTTTAPGLLSPKDLEDLKPYVDKTVQRVVGSVEPAVTSAALNLLASGADRYQISTKLSTLHPILIEKGLKLTDLLFELVAEYLHSLEKQQSAAAARKRKDEGSASGGTNNAKVPKVTSSPAPAPPPAPVPVTPSTPALVGQINPAQVREMMAQAQRMIEERKRQLQLGGAGGAGVILPPPGVVVPTLGTFQQSSAPLPPTIPIPIPTPIDPAVAAEEKRRKLAELQSLIQSRIASGVLSGAGKKAEDGGTKPLPLLLDNEGRAIDVSGKQLLFPTHQPTLKANIRAHAQKSHQTHRGKNHRAGDHSEELSTIFDDDDKGGLKNDGTGPMVPGSSKFFDERLAAPVTGGPKSRGRKMLQFNEPGKYVQLAHRQRTLAQLTRLQEEIAEKARKTGISTAARLAKLSGETGDGLDEKAGGSGEYIPLVEWWDALLLEAKPESATPGPGGLQSPYENPIIKTGSITRLIEHPIQLRCPTEPHEPVYVPVFLTKQEMKKLRRQNRREGWKEKQEKIRLGLEPPPEPKVRISNLMRVLGVEAVQDPTKIEAHVRAQMAKRLKTHTDANAARKLTTEQKRDKKLRKIQEDTSLGVHVTVYRVDDLTNQSKKFKVEQNAKQLTLSGILLLFKECNLIVVEGGPKQQKKYKRLMLSRIKWTEDLVKDKEDTYNKCVLVWEGTVKERAFSDLKVKIVNTEEAAREFLKKHGVENYWDLALSGSVLEGVIETV